MRNTAGEMRRYPVSASGLRKRLPCGLAGRQAVSAMASIGFSIPVACGYALP
jgi:hypothetical protein